MRGGQLVGVSRAEVLQRPLYDYRTDGDCQIRTLSPLDADRLFESGADDVVLTPGDSVTFAADVQHAIVNVGRSRARVYLIDVFPHSGERRVHQPLNVARDVTG